MNELLSPDKKYKLYFVEVDDEDRERVVEATVTGLSVKQDPQYEEVYSDYSIYPMGRYQTSVNMTIEADVVPNDEGNYLVLRDFKKEWEDAGS